MALGPTDHYDRGFHPTATCGVFGAAAAAGKVFGLDADGMALAFGIALSQSAGSMQFLVDGAWTKRFHVGHAARCGLMAATPADEGFRGATDPFEGKAGFFPRLCPRPGPRKGDRGTGRGVGDHGNGDQALSQLPLQPRRHGCADQSPRRQRHQAGGCDISGNRPAETGWKIIGDPEEAKHAPSGIVDGQFSMPFCAAVTLREGGMAWDDYARHIDDEKTLALCRRVHTAH